MEQVRGWVRSKREWKSDGEMGKERGKMDGRVWRKEGGADAL